MTINAVTQLRRAMVARSTKPFRARGSKTKRCSDCLLRVDLCLCEQVLPEPSNAGFCLVMHKNEPLKPSNTGKLIADVIQPTFAFLWDRTEPDKTMLSLLNDSQWQPYVVFPEHDIESHRIAHSITHESNKRPLFIMLDGSWREARKMFRHSPWLDQFPVLSLSPDSVSEYKMRVSELDHQLCTAEVAALLLEMSQEQAHADKLTAHYQLFTNRYMKNKSQALRQPK